MATFLQSARTEPPPSPPSSPAGSKHPTLLPGCSKRQLNDDRKAVRPVNVKSPPLKPLPSPRPPLSQQGNLSLPRDSSVGCFSAAFSNSSVTDFVKCFVKVFAAAESQANKIAEQEDEMTRRRWYRVQPVTDEVYTVRADPGLAGRSEGHPDAGKTQPLLEHNEKHGTSPVVSRVKIGLSDLPRRGSVPHTLERTVGLEEPGFNDTFVNLCKICYEKQSDCVVLPCKHGGFCDQCLKRAILQKPEHKGGRTCPWCRKRITEVIKLYNGGTVRMYGYAISVGSLVD